MTNDSNGSTIRAGRKAERFVATPEWIIVAGLSAQAQALYTALLAHVNRKAGDGIAWPGMAVLATMLGYRKRQSVSPYLDELSALGGIQVVKVACPSGQRNEYVVHEVPPPGYVGFRNLADFYAERRKQADDRRMSARADIARSATADIAVSAVADTNQSERTTRSDRAEDASGSEHTPVGVILTADRRVKPPETRKIRIPRGFYGWTDKEARHYLIGAAVKAIEAAGLAVDTQAAQVIGHAIKHKFADRSRRELVDIVKRAVRSAGDPQSPDGWLGFERAA